MTALPVLRSLSVIEGLLVLALNQILTSGRKLKQRLVAVWPRGTFTRVRSAADLCVRILFSGSDPCERTLVVL